MKKRNTIQKMLVKEMVKNYCGHPTAQEVYEKIALEYPGISMATVYRNLHALASEGEISSLCIPGQPEKYDSITDGHHHAVCKICDDFIDIGSDIAIGIDLEDERFARNNIDEYTIFFKGICGKCLLGNSKHEDIE